ncbi:hypothetical protein PHMEG_00012210 [Phytophthora megakarya]|uniref:Uncharacterized protein n=1 Tax=Phytophthora megakarya TaxID=4795 RepID=A0A225WBX0_9STRA|nr:hypothetical protein PHMEG_00012210 [Phytophthora megakarya]
MSYPYDSSWRRPPRSPPRNSYPRNLLTKRVTSVAALRRELLDRRQGRAPTPPSRNIPVPLWHGETFEQYKREFEQWLLERKETLASLRDNPSRERNFWFSFAHQRTEIATHEAGITRPTATSTYSYYGPPAERKRQAVNEPSSLQSPQTMSQIESSSERSTKRHKPDNPSSLESTQSSTQNESSRPETDKSSPVQSPSQMLVQEESSSRANGSSEASISTVPPIQRLRYPHYLPVPLEEYLAQHVVTPKEYLREIMQLKEKSTPGVLDDKLPKIPVPLTPGKTLESNRSRRIPLESEVFDANLPWKKRFWRLICEQYL